MATYSLAVTGAPAGQHFAVKTQTLADAYVPVAGTTITTATVGGMANAMSQNLPMLCKGPDGGFRWYTLDAERSTPALPILKRV